MGLEGTHNLDTATAKVFAHTPHDMYSPWIASKACGLKT